MAIQPDKQQARRILEMLEAGLVTYRHLQPWAVGLIESLDRPPSWICELASLTYTGDLNRCLREFVFSEPIEEFDEHRLCDYSVAGLVLMYERRALSWASALRRAGEVSDGRDRGCEPCEYYYRLLNELEDSEFDRIVERQQVAEVKGRVAAQFDTVVADFEPFILAFREARRKRSN